MATTFITYSKEAIQFVTTPDLETQFLDWMNSVGSSSGYVRAIHTSVGIRGALVQVHKTEVKSATVLKLVQKDPHLNTCP